MLLDLVYKALYNAKSEAHIVCIGSTTDRTKKGQAWLYSAEKKALRDYCNSLSLVGVWHSGPKVSYISFGTLDNTSGTVVYDGGSQNVIADDDEDPEDSPCFICHK